MMSDTGVIFLPGVAVDLRGVSSCSELEDIRGMRPWHLRIALECCVRLCLVSCCGLRSSFGTFVFALVYLRLWRGLGLVERS